MAVANAAMAIQDLRARVDGIAAALVARDGRLLEAALPEGAYAETFSVMCATLLGAAVAANRELDLAAPERIVIDGPGARTLLVACGRTLFVVAVVGPGADAAAVLREVESVADFLRAN